MPDWKPKIKAELADLNLEPAREWEIVDEVSQHLDDQYEDLVSQGVSEAEAEQLLSKELSIGDFMRNELKRRELQESNTRKPINMSKGSNMQNVYQDIRYALRMLFKNPGFTAIAVLTLSIGIGLNTSMFSVLNALLLRPPPFPKPDELAALFRSSQHNQKGGFAPADYTDLKREEGGFGRVAGYFHSSISMSEPGKPADWENTLRVSSDFFEILGVNPHLGRGFRPEEEVYGNHHVVIISHALWKERFAENPNIIGQIIHCNGEPNTIIGVLPVSAYERRIFGNARLFRPLGFDPREGSRRDIAFMNIVGRRSPTIPPAQGDAFIASFGAKMAAAFPSENRASNWWTQDFHTSLTKPNDRRIGLMLVGLSGLVLVIACSNLANLLLARAMGRNREFAVRAALGASRLQVLCPLAVESAILAAVSGTGALVVAVWTSDWLRSAILNTGGPAFDFRLDWRVLMYALGAAASTLLVFGIAPTLFTVRVNANETLKSGARGSTFGPAHQRLRHMLIVGQFALAMILLAGAGFFISGATQILKQDHGWDSDQVVQGTIDLPNKKYPGDSENLLFHQEAIEQLSQLPGVKAASVSYALPYRGLNNSGKYTVESQNASQGNQEGFEAMKNGISPSYFEVTGTRLLKGRPFQSADNAKAPKVVIINETMAQTLFPNANPIGRRIAHSGSNPPQWAEIVGVVADVRSVNASQKPLAFQVYEPLGQDVWYYGEGRPFPVVLAVRTAGIAPEKIMESMRTAVMTIDSSLVLRQLMSANLLVTRVMAEVNTIKTLLTGFASIGMLLAALGIYSVISRTVMQRTGEIGIRMALGAQAHDILQMIVGSGLRLVIIGAALGLIGSYGLSRVISSALPSMQVNSGVVFASGAVLLVLVALIACVIPARKASQVEPSAALRTE